MRVLFLSPGWPFEIPLYVRALARAGAEVWGVGDAPGEALAPEARAHLARYLRVPIDDEDAALAAVASWLPAAPDRVEALWEPVMLLAARLRERLGVPGMSVDDVRGFRDKPTMRARVEAAGVPIPATRRAATAAAVRAAAAELGFPVILKPVAGAGSADTWRAGDPGELERAIAASRHVPEVAVEQFVTGQELTYETVSIDGVPAYESMSLYVPNTLEARQNEWISPIIATWRAIPPEAADGAAMGRQVLKALRMGTGLSHMEWFRTARGPIFGEVACRPPGANMVDLMNRAGDVDLYAAWASVIVHGRMPELPPRPYHAAVVFKRAKGQGRIRAIEGLDAFLGRHGPHVARLDLLPIGAHRRDWRSTFLSDGNLVVRHPEWEVCLALAEEAAATVHLLAG